MSRRYRRRPPRSILALIFILLLVGLRIWQHVSDQSQAPTQIEAQREGTYQVVRVVDGDTLIVKHDHRSADRASAGEARVRLLSIDAPESVKPNHPIEPWGIVATEFTKSFVAGRQVTMRFDKRRQDRFGRWLAYIYVDDRMLNEELVRNGLAKAKVYYADSQTVGRKLQRAEQDAKQAGRGIWSDFPGK